MNSSTTSRLKTQLDCLSDVLGSAPPQALSQRTASGKWSALENLAHLIRHHEIMLERIRRILDEDAPALDRYNAEEDPDWPRCAALPLAEILEQLQANRQRLIAIVDRLTPEQMSRTGIHARMGPMPLSTWLEFFLLHEGHHLYTTLLRARGVD